MKTLKQLMREMKSWKLKKPLPAFGRFDKFHYMFPDSMKALCKKHHCTNAVIQAQNANMKMLTVKGWEYIRAHK